MKRTLSAIMAFALGICSTPGVSTPVAESDARSANIYYSMTMDEDGNWKEVPEYKPFKQSEENQDEVSFYPYTFKKDGSSETVASVRLQPLLMDNMYYGTSIDLGEGSGAVIASPVVTEVDMDFESSMLRAEVSSYDNKTELFSCCLLCPEDNASDKVKESEGPVEIKDGVTYYVLSMAYVAKDELEEVTITDNGLTVNAYMEYYVSEAAINSFSKGDLLYFGMTSLDNNEQPSEMSALLPVRYGMKALTKTDYAVVTTDNVPINTDLETEFTGSAVRPEVIVLGLEESGVVLKKGEDYTASFSNNIHAGTARVTIAGVGDYYGNITAQFTVSPATITANNTEVSFAEEEYVYSGVAVTPEMSVVYRGEAGNITLNKGTDYSQVYSNNTAPGQAVVTINGTGDFTGSVEAQFTITAPPEVYTISFDAGEGSGEMANVTVIEGNTFALPECSFTAPAKHEFYKWTLGEPGANVTITGNTTIKALWKELPLEVYTVSFDAGEGSGEMANVTVIEGNTFALPECSFTAPAKHEFYKWTLGEPGANVTITGNTTIKALWKELPLEVYTVSFDAGEGSGEMANVTVIEGNTFALPECSFTAPAKHEFYKWTLGEPGVNVTITGNTTITALWKQLPPEEYTVSFDAGEGSGEMANVTVIEGYTYTLPECSFTAPAKHEFYKWTLGEPGANVTITGNTTITALWKQRPPEVYTVSFDTKGGGEMDSVTVTEGEAYILPKCPFTKAGYEFETWDLGEPGKIVTITGNTTIIAKWKYDPNFLKDEPVVNGIVTLLNITDVSNRVIHSNTSNAVFCIDAALSSLKGAVIATKLTRHHVNATSNEYGATVFDLGQKDIRELVETVNETSGLHGINLENQSFSFDSSSSVVVGAISYNNVTNSIVDINGIVDVENNETQQIDVTGTVNNATQEYGIINTWVSREYVISLDATTPIPVLQNNFTFLNNNMANVYSGSTVVELTGEYLRTLEPGIYAIYFEFENGRAATLFAVENSTSVTPLPEEENGTGSGSGNETGNNTGSGSGNETGTESGTGNETETGNNTDSGNTGNERGENNAADTGSAGVIIYLMVAALLAGCVMSLSKGKKRRR